MRRREFLAFAGAAAGLALTPGAARASGGAGRRYRIFMVVPRDLGDTETGFQEYLARRNVDAEYVVRPTGGDAVRTAEIGRASCRERGCQYVEIPVVAVTLQKKKKNRTYTQP